MSALGAQEIRKINPGDTITVETTQYLVPGPMLIDMSIAIDSLDYWKAKYNNMESWKDSWHERYNEAVQLAKDKPQGSFWARLEEAAIFITAGYALNEVIK